MLIDKNRATTVKLGLFMTTPMIDCNPIIPIPVAEDFVCLIIESKNSKQEGK